MKTIQELIERGVFYQLKYGQKKYESKHTLDKGGVPLISAKEVDNGCFGFYDVQPTISEPAITIARTGSVGEAFVQDMPCGITSDCLILKPKAKLSLEYLYYVVSVIRREKWRYNFGRKITPKRLLNVNLIEPTDYVPHTTYSDMKKRYYPFKNETKVVEGHSNIKPVLVTNFFNLERGQFHALNHLDIGKFPTVSRTKWDNGIEGFYDRPDRAKIYPKFWLTVSTVTGNAFLQVSPFIATDNVVILRPKKSMKVTTLIFIQSLINRVSWRYSYGRQCYKKTFSKTEIYVPLNSDGILDEDYIESLVKNLPYWESFKNMVGLDNIKHSP